MSPAQNPEIQNSETIALEAAHWIEQRDAKGWGPSERAAFDAWIAQSSAHRIAFLRLDAGWSRAERLAALKPRHRAWADRSGVARWGRIAAGMALVAVIGAGAFSLLTAPSYTRYSTTIGGRQTIALKDGSRIELNTDSAVRVFEGADRRFVQLERGEAFFDVIHDSKKPFVVASGRGDVIDLGTQFIVRRDPTKVEVTLLQGRARFDTETQNGAQRSVMLLPGDAVIASAQRLAVLHKSERQTVRERSWQRGLLSFADTPLGQVAAEFNRYNRVKILIADPDVREVTIGGTFETANVQGFARVAQGLLGLKVQQRGDEVVISR